MEEEEEEEEEVVDARGLCGLWSRSQTHFETGYTDMSKTFKITGSASMLR